MCGEVLYESIALWSQDICNDDKSISCIIGITCFHTLYGMRNHSLICFFIIGSKANIGSSRFCNQNSLFSIRNNTWKLGQFSESWLEDRLLARKWRNAALFTSAGWSRQNSLNGIDGNVSITNFIFSFQETSNKAHGLTNHNTCSWFLVEHQWKYSSISVSDIPKCLGGKYDLCMKCITSMMTKLSFSPSNYQTLLIFISSKNITIECK